MIKLATTEKAFYVQISDQIDKVGKSGKIIQTRFLTLREQEIVKYLTRKSINYKFYGGYNNAERKRCLLYPHEVNLATAFNITCFEISYNKRYLQLRHQNVLGTLMSLKIQRALFGDIIFYHDQCFIFVATEIEGILKNELNMINNVPITLEVYDKPLFIEPEYLNKNIIISSLRIDNLISNVYNLSRDKTKNYILANNVYRNFILVESPSIKCVENDIISVRKYGRFIVSKIIRKTKSDRLVVEVKIPST
jgi:RNA-binding protein YlmH